VDVDVYVKYFKQNMKNK